MKNISEFDTDHLFHLSEKHLKVNLTGELNASSRTKDGSKYSNENRWFGAG